MAQNSQPAKLATHSETAGDHSASTSTSGTRIPDGFVRRQLAARIVHMPGASDVWKNSSEFVKTRPRPGLERCVATGIGSGTTGTSFRSQSDLHDARLAEFRRGRVPHTLESTEGETHAPLCTYRFGQFAGCRRSRRSHRFCKPSSGRFQRRRSPLRQRQHRRRNTVAGFDRHADGIADADRRARPFATGGAGTGARHRLAGRPAAERRRPISARGRRRQQPDLGAARQADGALGPAAEAPSPPAASSR